MLRVLFGVNDVSIEELVEMSKKGYEFPINNGQCNEYYLANEKENVKCQG